MNSCAFIGRIGRDAEVKYSQAGKPITVWSLAVDDGFGDNKTTTWFDCAMFGERGQKVAEYIKKGAQLGVTGSIRLDTYTGKDGTEKSKVALRVQDVTLLGGKTEGERQPAPRSAARPQQQAPADDFVDDDIPW